MICSQNTHVLHLQFVSVKLRKLNIYVSIYLILSMFLNKVAIDKGLKYCMDMFLTSVGVAISNRVV